MCTTPYHPKGNGIVERMSRTLLGLLRTLPEKHKSHWKDYLNLSLHAYNCTRHNTTSNSPYFLMFGHHPKLPLDIIFGSLNSEETKPYSKYVERCQNAMQEAYHLVMKKSQDSALRQKKRYDRHVRTALLLLGDCVLIKNVTPLVAEVSLNHTGKRKFKLLNPILEKIPQCTRFIRKVDMVDHEYFIEICCCHALSYQPTLLHASQK